MSTRRAPIEYVGPVAIYAPTAGGKPYHRLKWRQPDGSYGDTQRRTLTEARAVALEIAQALAAGTGTGAASPLREVVQAYLAAGRSPYGKNKPWPGTYRVQITTHLLRMTRLHGDVRAMDVTGAVLDAMRAQAGTFNGVRANTTDLRAFLTWVRCTSPRTSPATRWPCSPAGSCRSNRPFEEPRPRLARTQPGGWGRTATTSGTRTHRP